MAELETMRADLQTALDDVLERMGPASPMAQILTHALLRGDAKTMRATLLMCGNGGRVGNPTDSLTY